MRYNELPCDEESLHLKAMLENYNLTPYGPDPRIVGDYFPTDYELNPDNPVRKDPQGFDKLHIENSHIWFERNNGRKSFRFVLSKDEILRFIRMFINLGADYSYGLAWAAGMRRKYPGFVIDGIDYEKGDEFYDTYKAEANFDIYDAVHFLYCVDSTMGLNGISDVNDLVPGTRASNPIAWANYPDSVIYDWLLSKFRAMQLENFGKPDSFRFGNNIEELGKYMFYDLHPDVNDSHKALFTDETDESSTVIIGMNAKDGSLNILLGNTDSFTLAELMLATTWLAENGAFGEKGE